MSETERTSGRWRKPTMRHRLVPMEALLAVVFVTIARSESHVHSVRRNRSSWPLAKRPRFWLRRYISQDEGWGGIQRRAPREHHQRSRFTAQYVRSTISGGRLSNLSNSVTILSVLQCKRHSHYSPENGCTKFPPPSPQLQHCYRS